MRYEIHTELTDATIDERGAQVATKATAMTVVRRLVKSPAFDAAAYLVFDTKTQAYVFERKVGA
jgi:hypothetical protein